MCPFVSGNRLNYYIRFWGNVKGIFLFFQKIAALEADQVPSRRRNHTRPATAPARRMFPQKYSHTSRMIREARYQICIALPILLVLTILTAVVTIVGSLLGGAHIWGYYPGKIWSQLICLFLLIPVKVHGREKLHERTSYIFVPNHQGSFDIFLIYGFLGRNFKWMMKKSLRKIPFVGKACESAGHIFVDRSGPKKVLETIRQAKDSLKDGVSLVVFPEGARSFTGHMGYFKKGAFQLADDLQLAVVPVTIDGSFEILPRTGKWIHRHRMILTIHDPIPPKGQGADNMKATMAEAYTAVESALPDKFKGMVKNEDQDR